jgi:hypothetical protein
MPLYLFHVRGGPLETEDEEGIDLPDRAAAYQQALRGARSLIAAEVLEGRLPRAERIEVEDSDGLTILVLAFTDAIVESH